MVFRCMGSACARSLARRYVGNEVDKLFEQTGVKVTETLISIIDELLTKYKAEIARNCKSPELIGRIYSEARELYLMKPGSKITR